MKKSLLFVSLLILVAMTFPTGAQALTFYFDQSNELGDWSGAAGTGFGYVTLENITGGVSFEVGANLDYWDETPDNGPVWDKFYFNSDQTITESMVTVTSPGDWGLVFDQNVSTFGIFDFGEHGTAIGSDLANPLTFSISGSLTTDNFLFTNSDGNLFAGHLRRLDSDDFSNFLAVTGAPVPEPGTLLLVGAGLLGLGVYGRHRRKS